MVVELRGSHRGQSAIVDVQYAEIRRRADETAQVAEGTQHKIPHEQVDQLRELSHVLDEMAMIGP